jgi:hypothetical protein
MADALGARTAWTPAYCWIGRSWPVLPEYTYNAIRKIKNKIKLVCPIFVILLFGQGRIVGYSRYFLSESCFFRGL